MFLVVFSLPYFVLQITLGRKIRIALCVVGGWREEQGASLSGKAVLHLLTVPANYTTDISYLVHRAFTRPILSCLSLEFPWFSIQVSSHLSKSRLLSILQD